MRKIDISKIVLLSIMVLLPVMGKAQTFKHYEGIANKAGDYEVIDASTGCYRQKTHEYHYYVPVKAGVATALSLPIVKFMQNVGDALEPRGFFRYYNYDTDMKSDHLTAYASGSNKLKEMSDGKGYSKGLVAYNIGVNAVYNTVGVNYTRPKDANWTGETVACDVSRYVDGCENGTFTHEPTLSMRYIFHMIPAEKFADDLQTAILNGVGSRVNDLTYEDNKEMSVGFKDGKSQLTLRLNFNDITHYFFHPMKDLGKHHVYYNDDQYQIKESYFDKNSLMQANAILWRVYNTDKTMCKSFWNGNGRNHGRFFTLTLNDLNSGGWYYLRNSQVPNNKTPSFSYGSRAYVVAYAYNTSNPYVGCPIANFTVTFYNHYPMTAEQLRSHSQNTRLIDYLDDHYRAVAKVSFDDDDIEMTKFAPTTPTDNQAPLPSSWQKRSYGFVYPQLINKTAPGSSNDKWHNPQHSPIHGEYGLYKSANVRGISGAGESFTNNYLWYQGGTLHDRTYESTNGAQYGSFLYIDAADESRQIAEADFKANLCAGSQVIFSSAISDMTSGEVKPEVLFKLYGVHYDETTGKETDRKLLHSFSTGYLQGNVDDYGTCKWYQGYGKMVLQKESGVNNYENFKIVVDNLCQGTSGADYAFDDLRIYTQTAKVNVLQSKPICPDVDMNKGDSSSAMGNIKLKIRALQATMTALAEHQDKKLYFRFVDNDGNVAKDVNYGTESEPNTQWGTTTIYNEVDAGKTVDGSKMYEKIDDEWYVNLANRNFNLDPNKTYYVSMAFDDESIKDKNNLNWGKPSDVCSLYSETFKLVQQSVVVSDVNGNIATQVTIPCEKNQAPTYNIKAQIQTVDQNNGGSIKLQSIKFNWYVDSTHGEPVLRNSSEFKNVPLTEGEHTIYVEPTNASDTITEGGVSYEICLGMMSFKLRAVKNGPKLAFGFRDVVLPSNYTTTVRVGLPQIKALAEQAKTNAQSGYLEVPVSSMKTVADNSKNLLFVKYNGDKTPFSTIYLSGTNDPTYQNRLGEGLKLAELQSTTLPLTASTMGVKFQLPLHEGYWYEGILVFNEDGSAGTTVLCSGEAYLRFEVVPEYVTWNPTARNKMSAAWNNDQNWIRSTRSELYKSKDEYKDYVGSSASTSQDDEAVDRMNSYVPMKFTKVVIPNLSGLCFPDLGYIAYQKSNGIATRLSNAKGDEETTNIQYSIMAKWDANAANHGLDNDGNLACEKFYGNTCDQIYFKPGGELLDQCYLIYNKAWVEKSMKPNTWYALTSPLQDTYAGDMYVPKSTGRQETEAFKPISFSDQVNNRVTSPVYQRSWADKDAEEVKLSELGGQPLHKAYDYSGTGISFNDQKLTAVSANWSHVFNQVDKKYNPMEGFALKLYDKYTVGNISHVSASDGNAADSMLLMRLPKDDKSYTYYNKAQSGSAITATVDKSQAYRLAINEDQQKDALGKMTLPLVKLSDGNAYYLVGNPYMATLSMYKFLKANPALASSFYVYENGALKLYNGMDMSSTTYEAKNDVTIAPMQAFFICLADGQSADAINFTSEMTVDREVKGGVKTQAADTASQLLSLKATANGYSSEARVVVNADASEDYDADEDAQLLYDENLKDVPTLYTVAGNQAVAINTVPEINWLPLGVVAENISSETGSSLGTDVSKQAGSIVLSVKGASNLSEPLYLYDAATKQYRTLEDGDSINIAANEHGRYFLTQTRGTTGIAPSTMDEHAVKVYSPTPGLIVVSSPQAILNKVEVYTVDGKQVATRLLQGANTVSIPVGTSAVYIVKITTRLDDNQVITRKLSIR